MVCVAYMLYMPWGKFNIFDVLAKVIHVAIDDSINVPFLGYSWMYMALDVQFQLFVTFSLYSLFVIMVVFNYQKALEDWKAISEGAEESSIKPINAELYRIV